MLIRRVGCEQVVWYESPLLSQAGVPHGFSTRIGGVSSKPFDSLNLGPGPGSTLPSGIPGDTLKNIQENERRFLAALGCAGWPLVKVHQIHGCGILEAPLPSQPKPHEADALICSTPGQMLTIRVADCVPILLATKSKKGRPVFVAAIHAGWKGVVAQIASKTVQAFMARGIAANDVLAAIGPCIGPDVFEIGEDVAQPFRDVNLTQAIVRSDVATKKSYIDLAGAVALQLQRVGVPMDQIDRTDRCTYRDANEFFSYRRDQFVTGRMAAVIGCWG